MSDTPREPRREDFQSPSGRNPFGTEIATRPVGALANAEQQRSIAEVQARMIIARSNPRDPIKAMDLILRDCTRATLAKGALYQYARGGTEITGPTIRLAEAIAQRWGNIASGIKEISRAGQYSECVAYAWDLESGYYDERQFQVKHWRDTQKGGYALTDERDIYELVANLGQRRKRAVMLTVIPGDVVEAAVAQCEETLKSSFDATPEYLAQMLAAFAAFNVTKQQIEKRCQCHIEAIRPAQIVQLNKIYTSLNDGMSSVADWFDTPNGAWAATEEAHAANGAAPAAPAAPRPSTRKAAAKKAAAPQEDGIPFDRWNGEGLGGDANQPPKTDQPAPVAQTAPTSEAADAGIPQTSGVVGQEVPAETPNPAEAPAAEDRSTQSPASAGLAFSVWLVDGEGNELPDSDGVFEPFDDPVKFARAYKDVEGSLFPADIELFQRANEDNVGWACSLSNEALEIFTPEPAPKEEPPIKATNPTLPMAMPADPWFIPPPVKPTRVEFNSYVDRFKALLAEAANVPAVDHLVSVNSPVTERSDFLNSCRLQIKAATEEKRKDLMRLMKSMHLTHEELEVANRKSDALMLRVKACKTKAQAEALAKDVDLIADIRWLHANAPEIRKSTAVAMDEFVKALPG